MEFGEKMRPISDFLPRILSHIDGIDSDMAASYAMDSVLQFLRDSKILTEVVCVTLEDCVDSYKIKTSMRITEILSVRFFVGGRKVPPETFYHRIEGDTLYCDSAPAGTVVEIECAVAPPRDSAEVPDFIYEDWVDAVVALTLFKLYMMTDNSWHSPRAAEAQMAIYSQLLRQAALTRLTKHKPLRIRLANVRRS